MGHLVTPSYFFVLGARPARGRFFESEGQQQRESPQIVVSWRFWRDDLGSDPVVAGKKLRVNGQLCTIIGVGSKNFLGASPTLFAADVWMPLSAGGHIAPELAGNALERRDLTMFHFVGRLRRGVRDGEAEAALDSIARRFEREEEGSDRLQRERHVRLLPGGKALPVPKQDRPVFTEFFIVLGGTVLLIACANLMNMTLARAANRRREIAVRLSIGASRGRVIRQLITESMLVAGAAFLAGFGLAIWIMHGASQLRMPFPSPITFDLNPDWHAFVFTAALAAVAGFVFGLVPAWQATRADLASGLKEGATVRLQRFRRLNLRNLLVLSQIGGSLTLLLLTGLIVLGTQTNMASQAGFDPENLYLLSIDPMRDGFSAGGAETVLRNLLERVKTLPSIRAACLTETVPLAISGNTGVKFLEQAESASSRAMHDAQKYVVGGEYFETVGIAILQGRGFRKEDESETSTGVVVSESLVNQYWKGENSVGRRIEIWRGDSEPSLGVSPGTVDYRAETSGRKPQLYEVVGVAKDVQQGFGIGKPRPAIYFPLHPLNYAQPSLLGVTLIVRAARGVDAVSAVRREISAMDARVTSFHAHSMVDQIGETLFPVRVAAWTYGFIGICGLILASVGLAGTTAYSVARRIREIGIRMALGAQRGDVLRLVLGEGFRLVVAGTAAGLILALAAARLFAALFVSIANSTATAAYGRLLMVGAPLLLDGLAMLACYLPARGANRVDPMVALRHE